MLAALADPSVLSGFRIVSRSCFLGCSFPCWPKPQRGRPLKPFRSRAASTKRKKTRNLQDSMDYSLLDEAVKMKSRSQLVATSQADAARIRFWRISSADALSALVEGNYIRRMYNVMHRLSPETLLFAAAA